ncbi:MAG: hypothetical protein QGH37_04880 [Candidatus Poribacteria bacterium]|nr:hypothetical protein [Candidatus Poribacteria bacterium]MDP6961430.1 hypothetical protein [Dehalococcoidia bacterium]
MSPISSVTWHDNFRLQTGCSKSRRYIYLSIGTTQDGGMVAVNNHGVFRSGDEGNSWNYFTTALQEDTFPH